MYNFYFSTEKELLKHAKFLYNRSLGELSKLFLISLPSSLKRNKGLIGQLLELCLGIQNNNKVQQDFPNLGIELKTVVINNRILPLNDIFICSVPLINNTGLIWKQSYCYNKIKKILWIPILKHESQFLTRFRILRPFLWKPSNQDIEIIRKDWEEHMNAIVLGNLKKISSESGQYLSVRIKSKNKNTFTKTIGTLGEHIITNPRSFYFRKLFVCSILKKYCFL